MSLVEVDSEPFLAKEHEPGASPMSRFKERYTWLIVLIFCGKLVWGITIQAIFVFAPFLAKETGGLTLSQYRLGLVATDVACILPAFLPMDYAHPSAMGAAMMFSLALSFLLPQVLLPADGPPMPDSLAAFRLLTGLSGTGFCVVIGAVLSHLPEDRRTVAMARVEFSWTVASLLLPAFGKMLDTAGTTTTIFLIIVLPALVLAVLVAVFLPSHLHEDESQLERQDSFRPSTTLLMRMGGVLLWCALVFSVQAAFQCRYGGWLMDLFGMGASQVGSFSNAIFIGNLCGNFSVQIAASYSLATRGMCVASTLALLVLNAILAFAQTLPLGFAFVAVAAYYYFFEVCFLTVLSFTADLLHDSKTAGMSYFFAMLSAGRVVGDWFAFYPTMTELFAVSVLAFAVAAGALVGLGGPEARPPRASPVAQTPGTLHA